MATILDTIVKDTRARLAQRKQELSPFALQEAVEALGDAAGGNSPAATAGAGAAAADASGAAGGAASDAETGGAAGANTASAYPFEAALAADGISFICELKKASPSKGLIDASFPYLSIAGAYEDAGAAAISVLTEPTFFRGSPEYLRDVARAVRLPVLQKDFIIDPYQIYEAKLLGAHACLLICSILSRSELTALAALADTLGLSVLMEARTADEVACALAAGARVVGVNNRDLRSFEVDLSVSLRLRKQVPSDVLFVSESGISTRADVRELEDCGVDAILMGESIMRAADKAAFLATLRGGETT
jgi:indole-3-glycerol phosphate synthase